MQKQKQALRREVLQRLRTAAAADPAQLRSARLRQKLSSLLDTPAKNVGIYAPLPHEVNLLPLLQEFPQHRYAFPLCCAEHRLSFRHVRSLSAELKPGAMGIPAPVAGTPEIAPSEIDILIVPGVAFTLRGERLGYGGGYYDRYIPLCCQAQILALAFPEQIVEELPTEGHDLCIPGIVTLC